MSNELSADEARELKKDVGAALRKIHANLFWLLVSLETS